MRNISFALTERQFLDGSKDVTRRKGWLTVKPGDQLMGVRKGMGLKPGEKIVKLGPLSVLSVRREPLNAITFDDVRREGFPEMTRSQFIAMFCAAMKVQPDALVTRIEFRRVAE